MHQTNEMQHRKMSTYKLVEECIECSDHCSVAVNHCTPVIQASNHLFQYLNWLRYNIHDDLLTSHQTVLDLAEIWQILHFQLHSIWSVTVFINYRNEKLTERSYSCDYVGIVNGIKSLTRIATNERKVIVLLYICHLIVSVIFTKHS